MKRIVMAAAVVASLFGQRVIEPKPRRQAAQIIGQKEKTVVTILSPLGAIDIAGKVDVVTTPKAQRKPAMPKTHDGITFTGGKMESVDGLEPDPAGKSAQGHNGLPYSDGVTYYDKEAGLMMMAPPPTWAELPGDEPPSGIVISGSGMSPAGSGITFHDDGRVVYGGRVLIDESGNMLCEPWEWRDAMRDVMGRVRWPQYNPRTNRSEQRRIGKLEIR